MRTPFAAPIPRVPRSRRDDRYQVGHPTGPKRATAGWVVSVQDDTVTVMVLGEELTGVIPLGEMPPVGAIVEVESRRDLLVIPVWYPGPEPCVPGPWVTVNLAEVTIAYPGYTTATYTGGKIVCTFGLDADLAIPDLTLDRTKVYEIEVTCDVAGEPEGLRSSIYTSSAFTDAADLWGGGVWYFIRNSIYGEDVAVEVMKFGYQVSPEGWEDPYGWNSGQDPAVLWEQAFDDTDFPQERLIFETRSSAVVTQIRWRESCP